MQLLLTTEGRVFSAFIIFGLINNILYVVILSAAIDLVGSATPKGVVLLADIFPSLIIKILAPLIIHHFPYRLRLWTLLALSIPGMLLISFNSGSKANVIVGICMASASSGIGEISFLLLTHYYSRVLSIGGFSAGTGGAGLAGSFLFLLFTNIFKLSARQALLFFAIAPFCHLLAYYFILPPPTTDFEPPSTNDGPIYSADGRIEDANDIIPLETNFKGAVSHIYETMQRIRPLLQPYMVPLCSVYIFEYVINQGISPTLLFPLGDLPDWLFKEYRDIYVFYGFLYQIGVFISRSSTIFGVRIRHLYMMSYLQFLNVILCLIQSVYGRPFFNLWHLSILFFYEGLLGGLLYVNTFMLVSEQVSQSSREFAMGCVGISDSFGIMVAGCLSLWLEPALCEHQISLGKDWCRSGQSI